MAKRYVLTTGGLSMTPDDFATPASQVQAFTGGRLPLRRLAGVADDAGIAAYVSPATWTYTFDFTESDGGFAAVVDGNGHDVGVYTPGVGWEDVLHQDGPNHYRNIVITKTMGIATTLTDITVNYSMTTGVRDAAAEVNAISRYDGIYEHLYSNDFNDATPNPMVWSGTESFAFDDELRISLIPGLDNAGDPGGTATITSIVIEGTGENPFGIGELITSTDSGTSIDTIEIEGSGFPAVSPAFDSDDFNLGCLIVSNGAGIHCTASYSQASTTPVTGLDGIDDETVVNFIRVPYRKLATQALNNDKTSLQILYGMAAAVGGHTIFAANVNCNTGAVVGIQSTLTPIIAGVTYRAIASHNALSSDGNDTQNLTLFAVPVSGGSTHLLKSADGGTNWSDMGAVAGTYTHFVHPDAGGTNGEYLIAGSVGLRHATTFNQALQNRDGDFSSETTGDALGIIAI